MRWITLTTDFGTQDWFVGTMKGVVQSLAPKAVVVDVTHGIEPGNLRAGAFALAASYSFFPRKTVHVAVVDPGVGTERKAIAVQTENYFFVGPDNGVLSWALDKEKIKSVQLLQNTRYFLAEVSTTFHGRDIFAPVAAHLSRGVAIQRLGPRTDAFIRLEWPSPKTSGKAIVGEVLYIDRFGNAISNIASRELRALPGTAAIFLKGKRLCTLSTSYQAVPPSRITAIVGSGGFLEVAVNGGNAAKRLGLKAGSRIEVRQFPV